MENAAAEGSYRHAVEIAGALTGHRRGTGALELAWVAMLWGTLAENERPQARNLLLAELRAMQRAAVLGLARTAADEDAARDAIELCDSEGLPIEETVLALHGVLAKLPAPEIDAATDRLVGAAARLDEPFRANWIMALRSQQADAWIARHDLARARHAFDAVRRVKPKRLDAIAVTLALASHVRIVLAARKSSEASRLIESFLVTRALTATQLASSPLNLRLRAASDSVIVAALRLEGERLRGGTLDDAGRAAAMLIDALRTADDQPLPGRSAGAAIESALRSAGDRITRLAHAISHRQADEVFLLVIQSVGDSTFFVCIDADEASPVVVTEPDPNVHHALRTFVASSDKAVREPTRDIDLEASGRAMFDALPAAVRTRLVRARTIIVVPDFGAGQDTVPVEMLHDGRRFLGVDKVIARCLSLSHALRTLEAPLVPAQPGTRALAVSVADPPGFQKLRFVEREAAAVGAALRGAGWDASHMPGPDADPHGVLELAPLTNVLHLACHGEASSGAEALVLGGGARLAALDIATRHRLQGVTYLNACSLARGRYVGGGVSRGVAYAFARAGSPSVLANLLPVEDESASELAEAFYLAARDQTVGEALRRARVHMVGRVNAALWSSTILVGNPFMRLNGEVDTTADSTANLFRGGALPTAKQLAEGRKKAAKDPGDVRLAAAVAFSSGARDAQPGQHESLAALAREIGHDIGEAYCLLASVESSRGTGEVAQFGELLRRTIAALEPLRGVWTPAFDAHRTLVDESRRLDPTFEPRTLTTVRHASGLSVNDRSVPAVDAILRLFEAQQDHEAHWRGDPVLHIPDLDAASLAHNAVVWGYRNKLYDSGAEAAYAARCAARIAWRGIVPREAAPSLQRILAGLLHFLWGQQKTTHLDHWMMRAHTDVIRLAIERVVELWTPPETSPALSFVRELSTALGQTAAPATGSKFAAVRASLHGGQATGQQPDKLAGIVVDAVDRCHRMDASAAADLAAWVLGDVLERVSAAEREGAERREQVLMFRTLYDAISSHEEGWFMPYLMEGFKGVRETGGMDLFARWSGQVL